MWCLILSLSLIGFRNSRDQPLGMSLRVFPEGLTARESLRVGRIFYWQPRYWEEEGKSCCLLPTWLHPLLVKLSMLMQLPFFTDGKTQFPQLFNMDGPPVPIQKSSRTSSPESTEAPSLTDWGATKFSASPPQIAVVELPSPYHISQANESPLSRYDFYLFCSTRELSLI